MESHLIPIWIPPLPRHFRTSKTLPRRQHHRGPGSQAQSALQPLLLFKGGGKDEFFKKSALGKGDLPHTYTFCFLLLDLFALSLVFSPLRHVSVMDFF